jgi:hypothetical protein
VDCVIHAAAYVEGTEAALFAGQALIDIDESAPYPSTQR